MHITSRYVAVILSVLCPFLRAIPLFDRYPNMTTSIDHLSLGNYPTPLFTVEGMSASLGIKTLYVKDDGNGCLMGNKMRKLEFLLAQAKCNGYKTVCTVGGAGSNHALETVICAKSIGMDAVVVLDDQRQTSVVIRNLKLMAYFGAKIMYAPTSDSREQYAQEICTNNGYYFIPVGGSNALGSIGFVNAVFEFKKQLEDMRLADPDIIYVTLGSAGTAAGLLVGASAAGLKSKIVIVRISYNPDYKPEWLAKLVNETGDYLKAIDNSFYCEKAELMGAQIRIPQLDVEIRYDCAGQGYAAVTPQAADAISLLYCATGKKLEPTYTGKTLASLVADAQNGILKDKVVLFWNTFSYGKFEELTSSITDQEMISFLPPELTHYLTDPLQMYDQGV